MRLSAFWLMRCSPRARAAVAPAAARSVTTAPTRCPSTHRGHHWMRCIAGFLARPAARPADARDGRTRSAAASAYRRRLVTGLDDVAQA